MSEPLVRLLFLLHLASTLFMLGVIWFVQVVYYPLYAWIGPGEFPGYEKIHTTLTSRVVAPPMLVEVGTALLLAWSRPAGIAIVPFATSLALLGVIWMSTMYLQIPCHKSLARGFDSVVHRRLVLTNWLRTAAWSLRGLLVLWMAWSLFA